LYSIFVQTHNQKHSMEVEPLQPPLGTPVLWYLNGYGVKEI